MTSGRTQPLGGGRRPAWVSDELFPYPSRFLDLDGCRIHYVDEGTGPVILMLHGNPTWSFLYRHLIARLHERFRCLALDYPGFGLSTAAPAYRFLPAEHARLVEAFVEALDLRGITLFVQDWGGPIGLAAAARHPDRYRALIIANTWAWPVTGIAHFEWFSQLMGGSIGSFLIRRFNLVVNLFIPAGHRRVRVSKQVMTHYRRPFPTPASRAPTHIFPRQLTESATFLAKVEAGLDRLAHLPALIAWGDRDIAFRRRERERFESIFPEHTTHVLRGAGHFVQDDAADEAADAIEDWWGARLG
ncbi:MAG: alpha/beta fold hydrolase [Actinomycetota bacterium]|nr:alpha/beta fold hydrolase [Actinomycetota bacterium]